MYYSLDLPFRILRNRQRFGKYSGTEIKIDNEDYLILREEEVLGVIESAKHSAAGGKK